MPISFVVQYMVARVDKLVFDPGLMIHLLMSREMDIARPAGSQGGQRQ